MDGLRWTIHLGRANIDVVFLFITGVIFFPRCSFVRWNESNNSDRSLSGNDTSQSSNLKSSLTDHLDCLHLASLDFQLFPQQPSSHQLAISSCTVLPLVAAGSPLLLLRSLHRS